MAIRTTLYSDPACPWAYSATPALTTLRWRYGDQLDWQLVTIGLRDDTDASRASGYTAGAPGRRLAALPRPLRDAVRRRAARAARRDRPRLPGDRRGAPRATRAASSRSLRALAFAWFNDARCCSTRTTAIATALAGVEGIDAAAIVAALDSAEVTAAYEADKAQARSAAGGPTEFQGKAAVSDGLVRYTAPSVVFEHGERAASRSAASSRSRPTTSRSRTSTRRSSATPPPEDPPELLAHFPEGLCTQEVARAARRQPGRRRPRRRRGRAARARRRRRRATREPLGDDAHLARASR